MEDVPDTHPRRLAGFVAVSRAPASCAELIDGSRTCGGDTSEDELPATAVIFRPHIHMLV